MSNTQNDKTLFTCREDDDDESDVESDWSSDDDSDNERDEEIDAERDDERDDADNGGIENEGGDESDGTAHSSDYTTTDPTNGRAFAPAALARKPSAAMIIDMSRGATFFPAGPEIKVTKVTREFTHLRYCCATTTQQPLVESPAPIFLPLVHVTSDDLTPTRGHKKSRVAFGACGGDFSGSSLPPRRCRKTTTTIFGLTIYA